MARRTNSLTIIDEFAPDPPRCAQALLRLLAWEPPADAPTTDPARDAAPQEVQQDKQAGACAMDGDVERVEPS
jgi:hypothetical protein